MPDARTYTRLRGRALTMVEALGGPGRACAMFPGHVHQSSLRRFVWGRRGGGNGRNVGDVCWTTPRAATVVGVTSMVVAYENNPQPFEEEPVFVPPAEVGVVVTRPGLLGPSPEESPRPRTLSAIREQLDQIQELIKSGNQAAQARRLDAVNLILRLEKLCDEFGV